jgi:hypothetical protein
MERTDVDEEPQPLTSSVMKPSGAIGNRTGDRIDKRPAKKGAHRRGDLDRSGDFAKLKPAQCASNAYGL